MSSVGRLVVPLLGLFASPLLVSCFAAPPQIVSLAPARDATDVAADAPLTVSFDRPLNRSSVSTRFSVQPALPGCDLVAAFAAPAGAPCRIRWLDGDRTFRLEHPGAIFAPSYKYTFTLAAGVSDGAGATNSLDHQWQLTAAAAPTVSGSGPADGSRDVAIDAPLTIAFSRAMDATSTARAISLDPAVPGTSVVRSARDHSRFLVAPGGLLVSAATYRLVVSPVARDEHGQPLAAGFSSRFTTGALSAGSHAVVLAAPLGRPPTELLLARPQAASTSETIPPVPLVLAPSCGPAPASVCNAEAEQSTVSYSAALVSPGGTWVALVENTAGTPGSTVVRVVQLATASTVGSFSGASQPSWSPSGRRLAFVTAAGGVAVFSPQAGSEQLLPSGAPLLRAPLWGADDDTLILTTSGPSVTPRLELANPQLGARYALPGQPSSADHSVVSPSGATLAFAAGQSDGSSALAVLSLVGAPSAMRVLQPALVPLAFADEDTVIATATTPSGTSLVRVSLSGGSPVAIALQPPPLDPAGVTVDPVTHLLGYVARDARGVTQAYLASFTGGAARQLTSFSPRDRAAVSVTFEVPPAG